MISKIHKKEKGKKSKVGKWLHGVSLKLKSELTIIKKYYYWRNREHSGGISLTYLWSEFCSVSERLFLFTKSRTLTLLILAVCRMHVEYEPSIWPCSPWVLRGVSTRCLGGYRFESCQGLRFFLCPLLVTDNISFSHRKSLFNSYHWPLACGGGGGHHLPEPPTFSESPTTQNLFDNPDTADSL